jgi:hypothetical protein
MKRYLLLIALVILAAVIVSSAWAAPTADYAITWYTIDGGGGTLSGSGGIGYSAYMLDGTLGQPDAGVLTGGGYTLAGGYWGGLIGVYRVYLPLIFK